MAIVYPAFQKALSENLDRSLALAEMRIELNPVQRERPWWAFWRRDEILFIVAQAELVDPQTQERLVIFPPYFVMPGQSLCLNSEQWSVGEQVQP